MIATVFIITLLIVLAIFHFYLNVILLLLRKMIKVHMMTVDDYDGVYKEIKYNADTIKIVKDVALKTLPKIWVGKT